MEMESSRRSIDRSREPGLKKPRLAGEAIVDRSLSRPFAQPTATSGFGSVASRYRSSERGRDSESSGSVRGPYPQQQQHELVNRYKIALAELTSNSKPIITNLTIIAGENLQHAKAIAATVCANILEVPNDQKLPSLYLLDSIVKNIGKDYIKYFAGRLPEVFCKVYRQVDPSIHSGMRHLFGTWKRVFPPQPLQMIEKELGFPHAVNGSSSSSTTARPDSQSQCPAQSIHVNPKYLEARQQHQQSSRLKVKGAANDISGTILDSPETAERLDRTNGVSSGNVWMGPPVKLAHTQAPRRETVDKLIIEKNINAAYGDFEYRSDLPRQPDFEIGRVSERGAEQDFEKPWHGASVTNTILSQRNDFDAKPGVMSRPPSKFAKADVHLQPTEYIFGRSSTGMNRSWEKSDEEEYMWDDLKSGLTDHDEVDGGKGHWMLNDSEERGINSQHRKPSMHEIGSRVDREDSIDSFSAKQNKRAILGHRRSLWNQGPHSADGSHSGYSEDLPKSYSRFSTTGSSQTTMPFQPPMESSHTATSGVGISGSTGPKHSIGNVQPLGPPTMHKHSLSPLLSSRYPGQVFNGSGEQKPPQAQALSYPELRKSQTLGLLNMKPHDQFSQMSVGAQSQIVHLGNLQKTLPHNLHSSSPVMPSLQWRNNSSCPDLSQPGHKPPEPSGQTMKSKLPEIQVSGNFSSMGSSSPDPSNPLALKTSGKSSMGSLLDSIMGSGILSTDHVAGRLSNVSDPVAVSCQPIIGSCLPSGSSALDEASTHTNLSEGMLEDPPVPSGPPPSSPADCALVQTSNAVNAASNPVSSLLGSLVEKGLISALKRDPQTYVSQQIPALPQNQSTTTVAPCSEPVSVSSMDKISSTMAEHSYSEKVAKNSVNLTQTDAAGVKSLIGFEFMPGIIRQPHPTVIGELFDDLPHRCCICGLRLKFQELLDRHLEWHALRNPEVNGLIQASRRWYANLADWVAGKREPPFVCDYFCTLESPGQGIEECNEMVPADESQCVCVLCGELFEDIYCQQRGEWMFKEAVYMTMLSSDGKTVMSSDSCAQGPIVHPKCVMESTSNDLGLARSIRIVRPLIF